MSGKALIHGLQFAERAESLTGKVAVRELTRLCESLASNQGDISYQLLGGRLPDGRPSIHGIITGEVDLTCQRCLDVIRFPIRIDRQYLLVASEQELPDLSEEEEAVDALVGAPVLDALALIEDEVILSLPLAPRHEACATQAIPQPASDRENPFLTLKSLKH